MHGVTVHGNAKPALRQRRLARRFLALQKRSGPEAQTPQGRFADERWRAGRSRERGGSGFRACGLQRRLGGRTGLDRRPLGSSLLFAILLLGTSTPARALQGGEDASTLPALLNKQSGLSRAFQVSALFSTTLATKFTESTGATLNVQYNFVDQFGLELTGGLFASDEAQILSEIREQLAVSDDGPQDPRVSDMHQMQWLVSLNAIWIPIYGKISFASEWNPSFDIYFLAGGGVIGTSRGIATGANVQPDESENEVTPQFNFGGGFRLFLLPDFGLRIDVRNYVYLDPDQGEPTFTGMGETIEGFTNALVGQVGLQYNFGARR